MTSSSFVYVSSGMASRDSTMANQNLSPIFKLLCLHQALAQTLQKQTTPIPKSEKTQLPSV
jgi:hypothetical protein